MTDLVKDAAIVWIETSLIEEETLLYCSFSAPALNLAIAARHPLLYSRTSLETAHRRGDLHTRRQQIG